MKDKILVLGRGFLGNRLKEELCADISGAKIRSYKDAHKIINKFAPRIIINCIGYNVANVDGCEESPDQTLFANTYIPIILAEGALRSGIRLIHISSGCIYHYDYAVGRPVSEEKEPDFFELFYSRSKIYAERALEILSRKYPILIVRIRVSLDQKPHPRNILTKLINYKKVIDLPNSVTYIPDFILALRHLIKINAQGLYNAVNKGALHYSDLMDVYKKYKPDFKYETVEFKKLNRVRTNLILSTQKLEESGFKVRGINEVLEECVRGYIKY